VSTCIRALFAGERVGLEQRDGPEHSGHASGTVTPATFIIAWLQYFAFEKDIGTRAQPRTVHQGVGREAREAGAVLGDTNPGGGPFEKAGGKLILWQGGGDRSIPTISSPAYYQAVVKAMGGVAAPQTLTR
jgi:hypothetical protein